MTGPRMNVPSLTGPSLTTSNGSTAALATLGERARAARLRPLTAQRLFTIVLDTVARPGTIGRLDVPADVPAPLLPGLTLADVEVPLAVLDDGPGWAEAVHAVTGAPRALASDADIVLALRPVSADEVTSLRRGSAYAPEQGARLVLAVERLHVGEGPLRLVLSGPGVPGERSVAVTGLDPSVIEALQRANADFPAGVDLHLVAGDGALVSVPRSTTVRIAGGGADEGIAETDGVAGRNDEEGKT